MKMDEKKHQKKHGRGSVGRRLRYSERMENNEEFKKKTIKEGKKRWIKYKKKINNKCIDCGELIHPVSKRCKKHAQRESKIKYWEKMRKNGKTKE